MTEPLERRLAALLSADAVGYSRLMGADDEGTVRTLQGHRHRIESAIGRFRGRVVDSPGDNLLAEFPSALGAVRCALEVQSVLAAENEGLPEDCRMPFRIGIHVGDVIVEAERIYGEGVNIAARLEALAAPGAICVSDLVYQQVRQKLDLAATDLGERELKNIEGLVRVRQIEVTSGAARNAPARSIAAARVAPKPPARPSVAVLPFYNLNGDPMQEYFSEGLTHDITDELVRIPGLFVIGVDSMFAYKGTGTRPRDVAREVGVRHVLEGAVRSDDKRIRVNARLIDAESGRHVWAERFDRPLADVFAVQDEIADSVVTSLDVALVGGEDARVVRQHVRTPRALGVIYRGLEMLHRFTREDMREARRLFEEAIRLEPESPIPYGEAAWTHYFDVERGWSESPSDSLERMTGLSHEALERGDVSGFAHFMLAHMHLMRREYDEAIGLADHALDERPSCQGAWGLKANILNYCGSPAEAIPLAKQSLRLSPVAQTFFPEVLATAHYLCGHLDDSIATALEALALAPDSVDARAVLAASLVEAGSVEAAHEVARELSSIDPRFTLERFAAARPYREAGVLKRFADGLARAGIPRGGSPAGPVSDLAQPGAASRRRFAPRPRRC